MKVVVVSDSHSRPILDQIRRAEPGSDLYIHCGDLEDDPASADGWLLVRGNGDYFKSDKMPLHRVCKGVETDIFVCHGHTFPSFAREQFMELEARKHKCGIVLYGHTHVAECHRRHGITFVNPGSLWKSRDGRPASYAVLHIYGPHIQVEFKFEPKWRLSKHESDSDK